MAFAWQHVVSQFGKMVRAWCRSARLQDADAHDVAQLVFLAAYEGIERFRPPGEARPEATMKAFAGWLRTITKHKISDHFAELATAPEQREYDLEDKYERDKMLKLELLETLAASLASAACSVYLSCHRRNHAVLKCIGLSLWYLGKILHSIDELIDEIVPRLPFGIKAERLRALAESVELPDELDNLRRHPIWPEFKRALKFDLEWRMR